MAAETRKALRSTARSAVFQDRSTELSPQLTNLKDYIHNAISRLKDGSLVGSHLLGVGSKSIGLFDHALREILKFYIRMAAVSYEQQLKNIVKSKSIDELTLGEVIVCLRTLDKEITRICRLKPSTIGDNLIGRRLFTPQVERRLTEITTIRNKMVHDQPKFAKNEAVLVKNIERLLKHLESILADPLFLIPKQLS